MAEPYSKDTYQEKNCRSSELKRGCSAVSELGAAACTEAWRTVRWAVRSAADAVVTGPAAAAAVADRRQRAETAVRV